MGATDALGEAISNALTDNATQYRHVVAHLVRRRAGLPHLIPGRGFAPAGFTLVSSSSAIGGSLVRVLIRGWLRSSISAASLTVIIVTARVRTGPTVPSGLLGTGGGPLLLNQHGILRTVAHDVDDAAAEVADLPDVRRGEGRRDRRTVVHPSLQLELVAVGTERTKVSKASKCERASFNNR